MAKNKLVLSGEDQTITLPFDANIIGTNANEVIKVVAGVDADFSVGSGDRVEVAGNLADYTVTASGNTLTLTDADGNEIILAVGDTGTLAFADGSAELDFDLDTLAVTVGGVAVDDSFDAASVTLDAADPSTVGDSSTEAPEGETFTLTNSTATYDIVTTTAGSDTIDGSAIDSLQSNDLVVDGSTTDADVMNATVTVNNAAPTISNIETVNLNAKYGTAGLALTNVTGTKVLNVSSDVIAGSATFTGAAANKVASVVAGNNISSLSVTALSSGTAGTLTVEGGSSTSSLTANGSGGSDTFDVKVGMSGSTLNLNGGTGTDVYNVTLAGGSTTITGNTANETVNLVSSGAANTVTVNTNLTAVGATPGTVGVTGDQDLLLKATTAQLSKVTVTDGLTSGSLNVEISGTTSGDDLSKVAADQIELKAVTATDTLIFANNANVKLSQNNANALDLKSVSTSDSLNLVLNGTASVTDDSTNFFKTVNVSTTKDVSFAAVLDGSTTAKDTTLVLTGANKITLDNTSKADTLDASGMTNVLTATANAGLLTITGGSAADKITVADADIADANITGDEKYVVSTGAGNDEITLQGTATFNGSANSTMVIDGGEGTDTLIFNTANSDFTNTAGLKDAVLTNIEVLDITANLVTLTQKQGFTLGNSFVVKGDGAADVLTISVTSGAGSEVVDISGVTLSGTAGLKIDASSATGTTTLTGSSAVVTTIVGSDQKDTVTGGVAADVIYTKGGQDIITGGAGADIFRLGAKADWVDATGADVKHITDFVAGTDKFMFAVDDSGANDVNITGDLSGASAVLEGVTLSANATVKAMGDQISWTSEVNSLADVYARLGTLLDETALEASGADSVNIVARVVEFTAGSEAGKYLVINDATAGFQGANDIVIDVTGVTGTITASDFGLYTAIA